MVPQLPFVQPDLLRMPPLLRELFGQGPIHRIRTRVGHEAWLVIGYDEVRELLADDRLGRSHPHPERAARAGDSAMFGGPLGNFDTEFTDHALLRERVQPHFSPARMRAFRPRVEELATGLLDRLAERTPPADLIDALALPLPILVICELLGVPYEDRDRFRTWTEAAGDSTDRQRSEQGMADLFVYGKQLVDRKREQPGDDFISRLCAQDGISDDEITFLSMTLLFAGHETTVVSIGWGALWLLSHPEQRQILLDKPEMIPSAVEEILRVPQRATGIPRYARTDFEYGGVSIRTGDLVLLDIGAANHDPEAFPDPDRFAVDRADAAHVGFGYGKRYCLGAPLARIELQVALSQLIRRFPTMRLAVPREELRLRSAALAGGLVELPVEW